ncbi:Ribonuclease kappa-B [Trichoplax sp. H2]|uniref:Uncharacterized protein n=1 Tax=Trichoplax adhaerens TaxID=10228 RepID=B3RRX4_TRIAD|nr:expressed hypothetical protein [Trichoplax adhaerens]EDV26948.1 expressed hypothetical protein [Trichoplax adhaerens]RDD41020.1 Ribonuclease kappa-B [Trichoplax sp. H2]|eukprot:XP_002110944.1 expressed hypothetical protein [Trichoplax adhaerens]
MVYRFCGPKCSNCCFVLSIWGIVMLIILGIFFQTRAVTVSEDVDEDGWDQTATSQSYPKISRISCSNDCNSVERPSPQHKNCYIAAGMYGFTLLISIWQKYENSRAAYRAGSTSSGRL